MQQILITRIAKAKAESGLMLAIARDLRDARSHRTLGQDLPGK
jgi:hypothetical protein